MSDPTRKPPLPPRSTRQAEARLLAERLQREGYDVWLEDAPFAFAVRVHLPYQPVRDLPPIAFLAEEKPS